MTADDSPLATIETLWESVAGDPLPLPDELARVYPAFRLQAPADRPHLFANFVSSLDGVVALGTPGTGGDEISGGSREDRFVMGLLRATADVIVVGAGTHRAFPRHRWTPDAIYKPAASAFQKLRAALGKTAPALTAIVSAHGDLDADRPVFRSPEAPAVVVTTAAGGRQLASTSGLRVLVAGTGETLRASEILAVLPLAAGTRVLLECGPTLLGHFLDEGRVDELFLTLAPQIAGRDQPELQRLGLVSGVRFLPERPVAAELASVRRCQSLLFLRYLFSPRSGGG